MYCEKCGKENQQGNAFCVGCGAPLSAGHEYQQTPAKAPVNTTVKLKGKNNIPALILGITSVVLAVAMVLSLTGVFGASAGSGASKSFSTPEDAINYFVNCIKNEDIEGALSACAINEMARGFNYKAYLERLRVGLPLTMTLLPSEYKEYLQYDTVKLKQQIESQMMGFIISLGLPDKYSDLLDGKTMPLNSDKIADQVQDVFNSLKPTDFKDLKIDEIDKAGQHDTATNRENQQRMAKIYGADDEQFRSVLYEYNDSYYMSGFTLIEYNGGWMISSLTDPLASTSTLGCATKLSGKSDFYSAIGQ